MYSADILNSAGLFQRVGQWLVEAKRGEEGQLIELLSRATSVQLSLRRMKALSEHAVQEFHRFKGNLPLPDDRIIYWSPTVAQLFAEIPGCLTSIRRMQNILLPVAHRTVGQPGTPPPKSLADAMKRIDSYGLPSRICEIIMTYWTQHGRKLKDYRDIDQHHTAVVRHCFFQVRPVEKVLLTLPDNPETDSAAALTFNKNIDAVEYCGHAFADFHTTAELMAEALGFQARPIDTQIGLGIMGPGQPGKDRTLCLVVGIGDTALALRHLPDGSAAIGALRAAPSGQIP